jgi:hypothetical protein
MHHQPRSSPVRKVLFVLVTLVAATVASSTAAQAAPPTLVSCTDRNAVIYLDTTWNCTSPR